MYFKKIKYNKTKKIILSMVKTVLYKEKFTVKTHVIHYYSQGYELFCRPRNQFYGFSLIIIIPPFQLRIRDITFSFLTLNF